jgi:serine/threonine protein phosphatase 1
MHYVIGDVHGHYDMLMRLLEKLPPEAEPIFVGDLIDRGPQSAEVVAFVRENGCRCVMGNHESAMVEYGEEVARSIEAGESFVSVEPLWLVNGAAQTLTSYGLVGGADPEGRLLPAPDAPEYVERFRDDMRWMAALPLYIELEQKDAKGRPCVVSHAAIAGVWELRDSPDPQRQERFAYTALWTRDLPDESAPIYNIFGHTPVPYRVEKTEHYVDVDTGAYRAYDSLFGRLSAYCVEMGDVVSVEWE